MLQVQNELNEICIRIFGFNAAEYWFSADRADVKVDMPFPIHKWLSVYAVRGGSEGYYVHVDAIMIEHDFWKSRNVFVAKFDAWCKALAVANEAVTALGQGS